MAISYLFTQKEIVEGVGSNNVTAFILQEMASAKLIIESNDKAYVTANLAVIASKDKRSTMLRLMPLPNAKETAEELWGKYEGEQQIFIIKDKSHYMTLDELTILIEKTYIGGTENATID